MSVDTADANLYRDIALDELGETMLTVFECTGVSANSAMYVSTPITTGERLVKWHLSNQSRISHDELRAEVIHRNLEGVKPLIERVRETFFPEPVVEPVSMKDVPGWTQPQYHSFWCAFIERYAKRVVFNDGWYLSNGCVAEFTTALLTGVELLDAYLTPLDPSTAIELVAAGVRKLEEAHLDTASLRRALVVAREHR